MSESKKSGKTTKRVNKTKEAIVDQMKGNDTEKTKIKNRMEALSQLERDLGCVFVPMIQYTSTGSQTYIRPYDAPSVEVEDKTVV